ncbi:polypeptide GalNAc transferase 6 [Trichuris trichiura]|uniref:Polypeptide N-acetylgalactosaminyltransferase n=1 Tax=Trichuris trichiura TaxID=36087 RepID=A0A077Z5N1_TRITR|nr:polypeptide GalNAc transferase 6 [Trichuris trichiura]
MRFCRRLFHRKRFATFLLLSFSLTIVVHRSRFVGRSSEPFDSRREFEPKQELKDWEDHGLTSRDAKRLGPGEQGQPYHLSDELKNSGLKEKLYKQNGFSALVSEYLALNRSVKDVRHRLCLGQLYKAELPRVAVIIPFHNEHLSVLLRTVYSIVNRSPPELLQEIILADDFSSQVDLKAQLDEYVNSHWPGLVKIARATKREGLIRTRLLGAKRSTSEVLVFLDSHSECNYNWLPPLLDPIARDYRTVVCPFVDVIDYETFEYRIQDHGARGSWDWEFYYKRLPLLPEDLKQPNKPFRSPVMAGGYFAISAKWFWQLGGYDEGLDIWGGEQYELSFKVWQCGGQLVDAPCSHVGHIYRKFSPISNPGVGDYVGRNYKRVAEVWMDEYKEYLYMRRPHYRNLNPGDLTKQHQLRKSLNCKSFKWYMENIAFDQPKKYPAIEPSSLIEGNIRNLVSGLCLDAHFKAAMERVELAPCVKGNVRKRYEQHFQYTAKKEIKPKGRSFCLDVPESKFQTPVILYACHGMQGNQLWKYDRQKNQIIHSVTKLCLDANPSQNSVFMSACNQSVPSQSWIFGKLRPS